MAIESTAYGALFCMSGTERIIAQLVHYKLPEVRISPAYSEHYRKRGDEVYKNVGIFMPGYVFFQTENNIFIPQEFPRDRGFRLLKDEEGDWRLRNKDLSFVKWLFSYDAFLPISKAYDEGAKVRIINGPLKDLSGSIRKVDRRNQQGLVEIVFKGQSFRTWLDFDLLSSTIRYQEEDEVDPASSPENSPSDPLVTPHIYTGMDFPGR